MSVELEKIKYKRPAVIEAVCEFRFDPLPNWEMGSFIKFAELAKTNGFPIVKDSPPQYQVTFVNTAEPIVSKTTSHIQIWNESERQLWQVGQSLYAANQNEPYEGWEVFRPHILKGFELFQEVANPPGHCESLTIRYINKIEGDGHVNVDKLVNFLPSDLDYSSSLMNYICRAEYKISDSQRISITSSRDTSQNLAEAVILDVLFVETNPNLEIETLTRTLNQSHDFIIEYFERSITEELRKKMEVI